MQLTKDERNFLRGLVRSSRKKKEKSHDKFERKPGQSEEEFQAFVRRHAESINWHLAIEEKLRD